MRKQVVLSLAFLAVTLSVPAQEKSAGYTGPKDKLHIYILVGQSNMSGRATVEAEDRDIPKNLFLLDSTGSWVAATHPFIQYTNIPNSADVRTIKAQGKIGLNFGLTFARKMLEANKDVAIGLIVNSQGGSAVSSWKKSNKTTNYDKALERILPARNTGVIKGILWHQGEADVKMGEKYLDALAAVIEQFRSDLGNPKLPFVAGQIAPLAKGKESIDAFNKALVNLPKRVSHTAVVRAEDLKDNDIHFDSADTRTMGRRYAEEMLRLQR